MLKAHFTKKKNLNLLRLIQEKKCSEGVRLSIDLSCPSAFYVRTPEDIVEILGQNSVTVTFGKLCVNHFQSHTKRSAE